VRGARDLPASSAASRGILVGRLDDLINWGRGNSPWPAFFGLSCCFVEMMTALTPRFDLARFGAEVLRGSPRQADLMVIAGTPFFKMGPAILRIYEQLANPRWVMAMGSCANSGGMYDVYSVIPGVNQILPVDVYVPGCPPRPEAFLQGLMLLAEKMRKNERPTRAVLGLAGGSEGTEGDPLVDGVNKTRDTRGTGYAGTAIRGSSVTPPRFFGQRHDLIWRPPAPRLLTADGPATLAEQVRARFQGRVRPLPSTDWPAFTLAPEDLPEALRFFKSEARPRFRGLDDLTAIDESERRERPDHRFSLVYHLLSFEQPGYLRLKVPVREGGEAPSAAAIWPSADWYEREVFDMFGVRFAGHPDLRRLLMPESWTGHPLRKDHPSRATDMPAYTLQTAAATVIRDGREFFGGSAPADDGLMILNLGPTHPGTHGVLRAILRLDGEQIESLDFDIGYHHRGAEKIAERQHYHQFIPYTDRIDYLSGVLNNLAYLNSLEALLGVEVPDRARVARVLLCELFRIASHLVFVGTLGNDLGAMTPVFHAFLAREEIFDLTEAVTGGRMHPSWFRVGGLPEDLPDDFSERLDRLLRVLPGRLDDIERLLSDGPIFRARTEGVGVISAEQAIDWGASGPVLRACGVAWDLRRSLPYAGYEGFDFRVCTASGGDTFARYQVHLDEMRQSLSIVRQAAAQLSPGRIMSDDYRYGIPLRQEGLTDIESLIHHFLHTSRGISPPPGECYRPIESSKGECGYYIVSDGQGSPYRLRIRTPSFPHIQMLRTLCRGWLVADFMAILGSMDFVLADLDR